MESWSGNNCRNRTYVVKSNACHQPELVEGAEVDGAEDDLEVVGGEIGGVDAVGAGADAVREGTPEPAVVDVDPEVLPSRALTVERTGKMATIATVGGVG